MRRALAVLALAAALCAVAERVLRGRERAPELLVERLLPEQRARELSVAAVVIERPQARARWILARRSGSWRVVDGTQAVCDSRAIESLVSAVLAARVLRRSAGAPERAAFGLAPAPAWRLELCGPQVLSAADRDALFALDVGRSLGSRASLVERAGEDAPLELDFDLAGTLAGSFTTALSGATLHAPFEDARLIAGPFPGERRTIDRVFVDHADGTALELLRVRAEDATWTWRLTADGLEQPCPNPRAEAYLAFLTSVPVAEALAVERASPLGFERPTARVTALGSGGDAMVVEVVREGELAFGLNRTLATLARLDPEVAALVAPRAEGLLDLDGPNVWDAWLRTHLPGRQH